MQYFGFIGTPNMDSANLGNMEELAKLGVAMGVVSNMMGKESEELAPVMQVAQEAAESAGWICSCGKSCIGGSFCTECGKKRPEPDGPWDCTCGSKGLMTRFCTNCGRKRD